MLINLKSIELLTPRHFDTGELASTWIRADTGSNISLAQ